MKHILGFGYALTTYLLGVIGLCIWILFLSNLYPAFSIDAGPATLPLGLAILKNLGLVALFGLQHTVMARPSFKNQWTKIVPKHLERSTYVVLSGIVLVFVAWQWAFIDGVVWTAAEGTTGFYILYTLFFLGWGLVFLSTFLINHFDLFGLRQAYFKMIGKPYTNLPFQVKSLYKVVRHPLYLGIVMGTWFTPTMTASHLVLAVLMTGYILVGIFYEEKDMIKTFGQSYLAYMNKVPQLIPFLKITKKETPTSSKTETIEA